MIEGTQKEREDRLAQLEAEMKELKAANELVSSQVRRIESTRPSILLESFVQALENADMSLRASASFKAQQCRQIAALIRQATVGEGKTPLLKHIEELDRMAWNG